MRLTSLLVFFGSVGVICTELVTWLRYSPEIKSTLPDDQIHFHHPNPTYVLVAGIGKCEIDGGQKAYYGYMNYDKTTLWYWVAGKPFPSNHVACAENKIRVRSKLDKFIGFASDKLRYSMITSIKVN